MESLSPLFFFLVLRAVCFNLAQAALSAALAGGLAALLGVALACAHRAWRQTLSRVASALGALIFVLPGVAVAMLVLQLSQKFPWLPSEGWSAIVVAHVAINALFLASSVEKRCAQWLRAGGGIQVAAAMGLGASPARASWFLLWPVAREELRAWLPLVFLWCFQAFATVLILGGTPRFATPEVMLFNALQNDAGFARVAVLSAVQLAVSVLLARWAVARGAVDERAVASASDAADARSHAPGAIILRGSFPALCATSAAFAVGAALYAAAQAYGVPPWMRNSAAPSDELLRAAKFSLGYALLATATLMLCVRFLTQVGSRVRKTLALGLGISPPLMAALFVLGGAAGGASALENRPAAQIGVAALLLAGTFIPFAALWIELRVQTLPRDWLRAAAILGAPPREVARRIYAPAMSGVSQKLALMVGLGALGEIALASVVVPDATLLSVLSKRMAARYDFTGGAWVLWLMTLFALALLSANWLLRNARQLLRKFSATPRKFFLEQAMNGPLEFEDFTVPVPGQSALTISGRIEAGERVVLRGASGSGKTTFLKAVAGVASSRGTLRLGGQDLSQRPAHLRRIGLVFQGGALFSHLDVIENLIFGMRYRWPERSQEWNGLALSALRRWDLEYLATRKIWQLSGGEAQRVALLRTLLSDPLALLLDEPLSAVDPAQRESLQDFLREALKEEPIPVILVTHDQSEAARLGTRWVQVPGGPACAENSSVRRLNLSAGPVVGSAP